MLERGSTLLNTTQKRVALVTGAGQGIGRAIAVALAGHGCLVAVNDLQQTKAEKVAAEIAQGGRPAAAFAFDVADDDQVQAALTAITDRHGRLDILVNCARPEPPRPPELSLSAWWDRVMAVALKGAYHCAMAALPGMLAREYGRIVNISSIHAFIGHDEPDWVAYSCAKAGLTALTRSVARMGLRRNVTCNGIAPGYVETEMMTARWNAEALQRYRASVPIGRSGRPEEIADGVLFLVENGLITGETIMMTGGSMVLP